MGGDKTGNKAIADRRAPLLNVCHARGQPFHRCETKIRPIPGPIGIGWRRIFHSAKRGRRGTSPWQRFVYTTHHWPIDHRSSPTLALSPPIRKPHHRPARPVGCVCRPNKPASPRRFEQVPAHPALASPPVRELPLAFARCPELCAVQGTQMPYSELCIK